jgi:hypothetical protein
MACVLKTRFLFMLCSRVTAHFPALVYRVCPSATRLMQHTRLLNINASGTNSSTSQIMCEVIIHYSAGVVCACAPPHAIFRRGGGFAKNFPMCLVMDVSAEACHRYFIDPPLTTATTLVAAAIKVVHTARIAQSDVVSCSLRNPPTQAAKGGCVSLDSLGESSASTAAAAPTMCVVLFIL